MFKKIIVSAFFACLFVLPLTALAQEVKSITIGINSDLNEQETGTLLQELKTEINAVLGSGYSVTYKPLLLSNNSLAKAKANYLERLTDDSEVIITFGVQNTIAVYDQDEHPKPTIVFGSINKDIVINKIVTTRASSKNLAYIIAPNSYSEDLLAFRSLFDHKRLGVIVDEFTRSNLPLKELFDSYFEDSESTYQFILLNEDGSLDNDLENIDAIYLTTGLFLNDAEFEVLVNNINSKNIPSFSGVSLKDVERGILATNQPDNNLAQIFRRIALHVEAAANGEDMSDLSVFLDYKQELSVNFNTANGIGFPLRYSMLAKINFLSGTQEIIPEINYSLLDILNGVATNNLSLNASKLEIDLVAQDVKTAQSNYLPNATANAGGVYVDPRLAEVSNGANPEFSTAANATLQQLIYSPEASASISIQKSVLQAQEQAYNATQLDALLDASVAYFNALILKTNVLIQNENLQITKRNLEISDQNFESGASGKGDVLRFKSQLAQNIQALINASNSIQQAYFNINQILNTPINTTIGIQDAVIEQGLFKTYNYSKFRELLDNPLLRPYLVEFLVAEAKENAPELKNLSFNLEATERSYDLSSWGRFIPTVSLQGQYDLTLSRSGAGATPNPLFPEIPFESYNVGLNVSLPIFQQNLNNINKQTALIQKDQLGLQEENINLNIELNVNSIVLDLINQIANIELSKVSEESAKESLELVQSEYKNGAVPVIQLIDAQNNYLQAQLQSATANYDYLLTAMQLERIIGYFFLMHTEQENQEFIQRANQYILSRQ